MIGNTPIEQLGGENPPALPELPRITRRTRVPVRIIGDPYWSDRAISIVAALYRSANQRTPNAANCTPAPEELSA